AVSLIALLIGTQFQHVFDGLVRALEKAGRSVDSLEDLRHFISLLNVMLTGMGGALLGAAVSNRAQQCYLAEERKARSEIRELR
ncbi:hypothetical protein Q0O45_13460, partial [Staphylococcus aureus]|nr:hypothetical protein [Staphylococcus aureus]